MEFLLEPVELGVEFEELISLEGKPKITCNEGYTCDTGSVETE